MQTSTSYGLLPPTLPRPNQGNEAEAGQPPAAIATTTTLDSTCLQPAPSTLAGQLQSRQRVQVFEGAVKLRHAPAASGAHALGIEVVVGDHSESNVDSGEY